MITDNSIFSTSNLELGIDSKIDEKDFKDIVYLRLQDVLKKVFKGENNKQTIKIASDRFQFACPYCRDSAISSIKKRGNFIFKQGPFYNSYKCFNCGHFTPITKFFKDFDETLPLNAVDYLSTHKAFQTQNYSQQISEFRDCLFNADEMEKLSVEKDYLVKWFGLEYIALNSRPGNYLNKRCITKFDNFLYDNANDSLVILNCINNKVISFQIRRLSNYQKGAKYVTVSLKMIHNKLLKDNVDVSDEMEKLSMLFFLYTINPNKPILATEGPIDAMFLPNCIALLGASKSVNIGLPLWYVYDSDEKGTKEAISKLEKGSYVFMWDKLKQQYNLPKQKKWDINDFIIWCNKNNKPVPRLWRDYFSNDSLDGMLYI